MRLGPVNARAAASTPSTPLLVCAALLMAQEDGTIVGWKFGMHDESVMHSKPWLHLTRAHTGAVNKLLFMRDYGLVLSCSSVRPLPTRAITFVSPPPTTAFTAVAACEAREQGALLSCACVGLDAGDLRPLEV